MPLICFEGPQGAGKSTLINRLRKGVDIPLWQRPPEIQPYKEEHGCWELFVLDELSILNSIDWTRNTLLVDRHPAISEVVYAHLLQRESLVKPPALFYVKKGTTFIYLRRSWDNRDKRLEQSTYDSVMHPILSRFPSVVLRTDLWSEKKCSTKISKFMLKKAVM